AGPPGVESTARSTAVGSAASIILVACAELGVRETLAGAPRCTHGRSALQSLGRSVGWHPAAGVHACSAPCGCTPDSRREGPAGGGRGSSRPGGGTDGA